MVTQPPQPSILEKIAAVFEDTDKYKKMSKDELFSIIIRNKAGAYHARDELKRRGLTDREIEARVSSIRF